MLDKYTKTIIHKLNTEGSTYHNCFNKRNTRLEVLDYTVILRISLDEGCESVYTFSQSIDEILNTNIWKLMEHPAHKKIVICNNTYYDNNPTIN